MRYERYVQIDIKDVTEMIFSNDLEKMKSLYFEARVGGQACITRAIGLQQSFALEKIYSVKWFRREVYSNSTGCYVPYKED